MKSKDLSRLWQCWLSASCLLLGTVGHFLAGPPCMLGNCRNDRMMEQIWRNIPALSKGRSALPNVLWSQWPWASSHPKLLNVTSDFGETVFGRSKPPNVLTKCNHATQMCSLVGVSVLCAGSSYQAVIHYTLHYCATSIIRITCVLRAYVLLCRPTPNVKSLQHQMHACVFLSQLNHIPMSLFLRLHHMG